MRFDVSVDITGATRMLDRLARDQVPFAASKTINAVAQKVLEAEQHEMRDVFDRPTPYTMNSMRVIRSTKQRLVSVVEFKENNAFGNRPASKYMSPSIKGGSRRMKGFELLLRNAGVMPDGYRAVPGRGLKLDAYGNVRRGDIIRIISYFRAFPERGYKANITDRRRAQLKRGTRTKFGMEMFVGRPADGRLPFGIWQRDTARAWGASRLRPIFLFVGWTQYEAIFDFEYVGRKTVEREFGPAWDRELAAAVASARAR